MLARVLCVDDEVNVLKGLERILRGRFDIHVAVGPEQGLQAVRDQAPFAAVISDLRMPGMDGIQFLTRLRTAAPNTVRLMLTGQADLANAIAAVNQGHIFQFLTKPCPPEMLIRAIEAAVQQYSLLTVERDLLEKTLLGSIGVFTELLSMANPAAFSRAQRIRRYIRQIAGRLALPDAWQCEIAAMLSQIGTLAIPPEIRLKQRERRPLTDKEADMLESQHRVGHDLLSRIPRLETVADIVACQHELWDSTRRQTEAQSRGHLLRVVIDFDQQLAGGATAAQALSAMRAPARYNPAFLDALDAVQGREAQSEIRAVPLSMLRTGMVLHADLMSRDKVLLVARGQEITDAALSCIHRRAVATGVEEPIHVIVPQPVIG